ncbi:MAG: Uma2 family endonuclease [Isosphaeraceae bacterium]
MSTITGHVPVSDSASNHRPYRISVDQYEAMLRAGIFTKHDRLELIEGILVKKMTKGARHCTASEKTWRVLYSLIPPGWHIRIEKPVRIPEASSEPEPDLSVVRGEIDDYGGRNPESADVALVVEVSESSLAGDRGQMARVYGGSGIPVYWIINLIDRQLEVYSNPVGGVYPPPTIIRESQSVTLTLGEQHIGPIAVADLLPKGV